MVVDELPDVSYGAGQIEQLEQFLPALVAEVLEHVGQVLALCAVQALERLFSRTDMYPAAAGGDENLDAAGNF